MRILQRFSIWDFRQRSLNDATPFYFPAAVVYS
jgi:hypothetical protein